MTQVAALLTEQIGWKKCVACSDSKMHPHQGQMWIGGNNYVTCPVCGGSQKVPLIRYRDLSGRVIEPEKIGREIPI